MKTAQIIIHFISLLVAIAGGVLAIGDKITSIPGLDPHLVNAWPTVLFAATAIDRIGSIIINFKLPKAVTTITLILFSFIFSGCSTNGTKVVESVGIGGSVTRDEETRTTTGNGQITVTFRDGRDAKTIRQLRVK